MSTPEQPPARQRSSGIQWRQGLLGGLAVLAGLAAGTLASGINDSMWVVLPVTGLVVVLVMLAGRPFLPRR